MPDVVENEGGGEEGEKKPKSSSHDRNQKIKKSASKRRGRSPGPSKQSPTTTTTTTTVETTKKREQSPAKQIPQNPDRTPDQPSSTTSRGVRKAVSPKGERRLSPKRDDKIKSKTTATTTSTAAEAPRDDQEAAPLNKDTKPRAPQRHETEESLVSQHSQKPRIKSPGRSSKNPSHGTTTTGSDKDLLASSNSRRGDKPSSTKSKGRATTARTPSPPLSKNPARAKPIKNNNNNNKASTKKSKDKSNRSDHPTTENKSLELEHLNDGDEEDGEGTTVSEFSSPPRYVTSKGNSTHLQLDMSTLKGGDDGDLPVFSLLDDNSLLDSSSVDDDGGGGHLRGGISRNPKLDNPLRDSLLNNVNGKKLKVQKRLSQSNAPPPDPLVFQPWGLEEDDDDDDDVIHNKGHHHHNSNTRNSHSKTSDKAKTHASDRTNGSRSLSPMAFRKAVKAFKYTTNISGASNLMGKMTTNLQHRLGLTPNHQQMNDDDDLDSLL